MNCAKPPRPMRRSGVPSCFALRDVRIGDADSCHQFVTTFDRIDSVFWAELAAGATPPQDDSECARCGMSNTLVVQNFSVLDPEKRMLSRPRGRSAPQQPVRPANVRPPAPQLCRGFAEARRAKADATEPTRWEQGSCGLVSTREQGASEGRSPRSNEDPVLA